MAKKTVAVVIDTVKQEEKTWVQKIKDFFYNSETVAFNWFYGVAGTVTATVMGVLSSADYSSIVNMLKSGISFTKPQIMMMGIGALLSGVMGYILRVRGTKEVDSRLLPKAE